MGAIAVAVAVIFLLAIAIISAFWRALRTRGEGQRWPGIGSVITVSAALGSIRRLFKMGD